MSILGWLTDRIILGQSRHAIQAPGKRRALLSHGDGHLKVWTYGVGQERTVTPDLYVLKFPGTASRAEDPGDFVEFSYPCPRTPDPGTFG